MSSQVEITLQTMAFWQWIREGEKYATGSLVPLAIYTIRQSLLQDHICWKWSCCEKAYEGDPLEWLRWTLSPNHPAGTVELLNRRWCRVGHGNRYTAIYPYFFKFKASFLDPRTHHYLKKISTVGNFNQVHLIINSAVYHHHTSQNTGSHYPSNIFSSYMHIQLKSDILKKAILSFSPSTSESTNPIDSEASSDNSLT